MIARFLIWLALRTPYFHLHHADGSLYMGRYWLMPRFLLRECSEADRDNHRVSYLKPRAWLPLSLRLHRIATNDVDRDMHDHPAGFVSIVLSGGYIELRPTSVEPCFADVKNTGDPRVIQSHEETGIATERRPGSIAYRRATDRHRIIAVKPDTWTLVIWFRKVQWWGFYTVNGKIHWREYESAHNIRPIA